MFFCRGVSYKQNLRGLSFLMTAITLIALTVVSVGWAAEKGVGHSGVSDQKIRALANEYYLSKAQGILAIDLRPAATASDDRCRPHEPHNSCIDAVCAQLSSFACDDQSEIRDVAMICANQRDGRCIQATCGHMSKFNCDDFSEVKQVAKICEGQYDNRCIDTVCGHLSSYNCDDLSELNQVGEACRGFNDVGCVESVCGRLSRFECDDLSELKKVIGICKGQ